MSVRCVWQGVALTTPELKGSDYPLLQINSHWRLNTVHEVTFTQNTEPLK